MSRPALMLLSFAFPLVAMAEPSATRGEAIYKTQCLVCHGANGAGTTDFPEPLLGDKSVGELTAVIHKTMPEGSPEDCVDEDARAVAEYIHAAFYSPIAQERSRPARIALSRLTRTQHENAVADLVRSFRAWGEWDDKRGLRGEYYTERRIRKDKRQIDRLDPVVDFNFGKESPLPGKINKDEFAVAWSGAVLAPETGDYEFILRTGNGARLYVNNDRTPLVDAWVRSGGEMDYRATIRLLGGRAYPLRLESFKFKDDGYRVALQWKPPHGVTEVIPARYLSPNSYAETFVLTTAFPPDDRSTGYERGNSVSPAWVEATAYAALETADYVVPRLRDLADARDDKARDEKLRKFAALFAERAFRRPLTAEEKAIYVDKQFATAPDATQAVRRVVVLVCQSPFFLYREIPRAGKLDQYDIASWLAFTLWDSIPDKQLYEFASKGWLKSRADVVKQVDRMLADPRTRTKLRGFFHQWLNLDSGKEMAKDGKLYPEFDAAVMRDLRLSLDLLLDEVMWSKDSDYRRLLRSDEIYLNGRLAKVYGVNLSADADFQKVAFEPERRAGLITHPYLLAEFAYDNTSSPIHRGVFLARDVLGRVLIPPSVSVAPTPPDLHPNLTTRERVMLQTNADACIRCHQLINGLGFTLEHYDAIGRYRDREKGKPIDASGNYRSSTDDVREFANVRDLADYLASSPESHASFVKRLFHFMVKQPIRAYGPNMQPQLAEKFAKQQFNMRQLVVEMAVEAAEVLKEAPDVTR